jgi:hypothetical protein
METLLLESEEKFNWWKNGEHPSGKNAKNELKRMLPPKSYPCVISWVWVENSYDCKDWLSYSYVYPSDFNK